MPIPVTCACGKSFRAKDELAGKRVRCPGCGGVLEIASAAPEELAPSTNGASHPAGSWNPASPALSNASIANQPVQRKPPVQARPVMAVAVPQFPPIVAAPAYYSAGPPAFQAPVNQGAQGYGLSAEAPPTHSYQFTPAPSTSMTARAKSQSAAVQLQAKDSNDQCRRCWGHLHDDRGSRLVRD